MKPIFEKISKPEVQSYYFEEVIKPYFSDPWHFHPEIEILYVREGYGTKYVGDSINTFYPGDVVIIGSNIPHVWSCSSDYLNPENKLNSNAICIQFMEDFMGKSSPGIPEFHIINEFLKKTKRGIQFVKKTREILIKHIANSLGTDLLVLWLAREGTYIRESKDSKVATERIVYAINQMLEYDSKIRVCIVPKPNEPMDQSYIPTTGYAIALSMLCVDPKRLGVNIESAHAILAGLDPSDEMGYALAFNKLWTVHLNDQNGLKFDQDKTFGSVDIRRAFNQVRILDKYDYGKNGEWVGLDVKAMRTQKDDVATKHLSNSREIFLRLLEISRSLNEEFIAKCSKERDYEELDLYIIKSLVRG